MRRRRHPLDVRHFATARHDWATTASTVGPETYDQPVIHLEAPTHRIPPDESGKHHHQAGPVLQATADTYDLALQALDQQVPDGHRLTWIRRAPQT